MEDGEIGPPNRQEKQHTKKDVEGLLLSVYLYSLVESGDFGS